MRADSYLDFQERVLPVYPCFKAHCPRFSVNGNELSFVSRKSKMDEIDESGPNKRKKTETFIPECKDLEKVNNAYSSLCFDRRNPLIVQQIPSCNAAAGWCRVNFSRASCETCTITSDIYPFGSLFLGAMHLLNGFFTEPEYSPGDKSSKLLSGKVAMLLHMLMFLICWWMKTPILPG